MKYILFLLFLSGCAKLKYGNVISKNFEPAHTVMLMMPVSTGKTTIIVPEFFYYSDSYKLTVKGVSTKGKPLTKAVYVTARAYDTISLGQFLCVDGMCNEPERKRISKPKL